MDINVTMSQEEFEDYLEFKRNKSKELHSLSVSNASLRNQLEDLATAICSGIALNESDDDWEIHDNEEIFRAIKLANEVFA